MKHTKTTLFYPLLFLALLSSFNSCELVTLEDPDDMSDTFEPESIPTSISEFKEQLHGESSRNWGNVNFTLAGIDGFQECRLDDSIIVSVDGTYEYDGGSMLCGAEDDQRIRIGTWEITNAGRNIIFDKGTSREYVATVNGLQNNTLALSGSYLGLPIKGTYTTQ